jgi:hypothetical protein
MIHHFSLSALITRMGQIGSLSSPNTSFQRTLTRGGRGPLNSDR